jgi:hypothetical protein
MPRAEQTRLDSWKEIAAYLGHALRTVRRWEKERALPIHRIPGAGRRAVYALRSEIDAWLFEFERTEEQRGDVRKPTDSPTEPSAREAANHISKRRFEIISNKCSHEPVSGHGSASAPKHWMMPAAVAMAALAVVLSASLIWTHKNGLASTFGSSEPVDISFVSPILPQPNQTIAIRGTGFGMHTPYKCTDSPFLAFRDHTARWAAGRIIPQNWDEVTLDVRSWEDTQIVLSGFSGSYGLNGWTLSSGDEVEIAVWNPQSGRGPAVYHLTVSPASSK